MADLRVCQEASRLYMAEDFAKKPYRGGMKTHVSDSSLPYISEISPYELSNLPYISEIAELRERKLRL